MTVSGATRSLACWQKLRQTKPSGTNCSRSRDAVRYNGKLIAYPIAVEALSLIYNKDRAKPAEDPKRSLLWIKS